MMRIVSDSEGIVELLQDVVGSDEVTRKKLSDFVQAVNAKALEFLKDDANISKLLEDRKQHRSRVQENKE
jgi:hypothetical protein